MKNDELHGWGRKIAEGKYHVGYFINGNPEGDGIGNLYTDGDEEKMGVYKKEVFSMEKEVSFKDKMSELFTS
jgi:hypothetical protein